MQNSNPFRGNTHTQWHINEKIQLMQKRNTFLWKTPFVTVTRYDIVMHPVWCVHKCMSMMGTWVRVRLSMCWCRVRTACVESVCRQFRGLRVSHPCLGLECYARRIRACVGIVCFVHVFVPFIDAVDWLPCVESGCSLGFRWFACARAPVEILVFHISTSQAARAHANPWKLILYTAISPCCIIYAAHRLQFQGT